MQDANICRANRHKSIIMSWPVEQRADELFQHISRRAECVIHDVPSMDSVNCHMNLLRDACYTMQCNAMCMLRHSLQDNRKQ